MRQEMPPLDGRVELRCLLGEGGSGEVHRAWDRSLERAVALKFIRDPEPSEAERLILEARLQARVQHPHVVQVFEVGRLGGRPCIVMQLVEGSPLDDLAAELTVVERVELVRQAALGLHAAHCQGLVHRDVKPGNVLVEQEEAGRHALVSDFGLARDQGGAITRSGLPAGTVDFMSPEQLLGKGPIDFRSDVYGLGATLYAVLAGAPPFRTGPRPGAGGPTQPEEVAQVLRRILDEEPPPLRDVAPAVAPELGVVAAKAMEKDPAARYASAEAFAEDLARFQRGEPVLARRATPAERALKWSRRNRTAARAIAAGALAAILGLGWAAFAARRAALEALEAARLGALAERFESRIRAEHLAPRHDLRPARAAVRAEAEELRAGGKAERSGPASFALGKGLELTGDLEGARAAYERAWALGHRAPAVAEGLGSVLARLYHRAAANVSETLTAEARARQLEPLQREFREPALRLLAQGEQAGWRGPYLRGQMALLEQRWDEARAAAGQALSADPGRYEARVLEAEAWLREGRIVLNRFQPEPALGALRRALAGLGAAEAFGRSDPKVLELLSLGHSSAALALQRAGKDPAVDAEAAAAWADRGSAVDPEGPAFLVARAKSMESRALRAAERSPASALPLLAESDGLYARAAAADPGWAEPPGQLAYVRYVRAALLRQTGRASREVLAGGLEAAAEAARRAPQDDYPTFLTALLRIEEGETLQAEGVDASEPLRRGAEAGERLLASAEAGNVQGHALAARAWMALAREDWLGGRDPRGSIDRGFAHLEASLSKKPGDVEGAIALAEGAVEAAWRLHAMGEDPGRVVGRGHAVATEALARSAGLALAQVVDGHLFAFEARLAADGGADPRRPAAEGERRLSGARAFADEPSVREALAALPLAEAAWRVARGMDPSRPLALAERRARAILERDARSTEALAVLGSAALQRALWQRRSGRAAAAEARRGLTLADRLVAASPRVPERWVLRARLAGIAGERAASGESLSRAAALNPLVRRSAAWKAAEAEGTP